MGKRLRASLLALLVLLVFVSGLTGGVILDRFVVVASANTNAEPLNMDLIQQAWQVINTHFVGRKNLDDTKLTYGAISGMVDALGDTGHSTFLTPEMLRQQTNYTRGAFEGIGAQVEKKGNHIVILAPMDNSPALAAGLEPGDIILKVNGEDLTGSSVEHAIDKISGRAGTQVTLTIMDPDTDAQRDVTLTRARIRVDSVLWSRVPGTNLALIRISGFSNNVSDNLKQALTEIKEQKYDGLILDLRNNPGGLLHEAISVTSQFLKQGNALLQRDAAGNTEPVSVEPGGLATDIPLVVLINYGSASASEIVSGAIQDAGRGQLVGETTFGTGTVLNTFTLSDGSALLLATEEWLTPNGRVIWHKGIQPDHKASLPNGANPLSPTVLKTMTPEQFQTVNDTQLHRAIELLTCPNGDCAVGQTPNKQP